uniref:DUF834 domain-containing protein n=1 Tax=Oryza nivara TaxID=4536 RepID=A0A0E0G755_ORYNI
MRDAAWRSGGDGDEGRGLVGMVAARGGASSGISSTPACAGGDDVGSERPTATVNQELDGEE